MNEDNFLMFFLAFLLILLPLGITGDWCAKKQDFDKYKICMQYEHDTKKCEGNK